MPNVSVPLRDEDLAAVIGGYTGPVFEYEMKKGDTLSSLAQRFGTTVRVLQELNNIHSQSDLYAGMKLSIPQ